MKFLKTLQSYNVILVNLFCLKYTLQFSMPRKSKKAKFKPHKVAVNQYGEIFSNSGAVNGISPIATLNYFFEIFSDRIEKDVIKLVLDECEFNVDQASETLMSLCNDDAREQPEYDEKITELSISDYGLPYHNNVVCPGMNAFNTGAFTNIPYNSQSFIGVSSGNPNDAAGTSAENQVLQECDDQSFINHSWNDYAAWGETSIEKSNSTTNCSVSDALCNPSANNAKETQVIASSSNLNPNAPSFIVPLLPMHSSTSPHKSPGLEANKGFWNVPDSRHFSSSSKRNHRNKKDNPLIKDVSKKIQSGHHILVILRGLPGSGKSTLALKLKFSGVIFSTDDFFIKNGKYIFDPSRLHEAHEWNKLRTKIALQRGITPVIIDNTNTEAWEMKPYVLMGEKHNYEIVILEPDTPWKFNVSSLALRNKHHVPKSKIAHMKERYEYDITIDKILAERELFSSDIKCTKDKAIKTKTTTDDNNVTEGNHISLKAIVHIEDNSTEEKSQFLIDNDLPLTYDKENNTKTEEENMQSAALNWNSSVDDNSVPCHISTICNLDELRALAKNDSEDSQSCYSSSNSSSQELSGWEAITEHDHDFQWSASSSDLNLNSKFSWKSRSADNLYLKESTESSSVEDVVSFSQNSSENIINVIVENKPAAVELESYSEPYLTSSSLHKKEKYMNNSQMTSEMNRLSVSQSNSDCFNQYVEPSVSSLQVKENNYGSVFCDNHSEAEKLWSSCEENDTELTNQLSAADLNKNDDISFKSSTESLIIHEERITDVEDTNQNVGFEPKPQRNNCSNLITFNRNHFLNRVTDEKPESTEDINNLDTADSDWNSIDGKNYKLHLDCHSEVTYDVEAISTPKPQRPFFRNSLSIEEDKVIHSDKTKCLLNISADSIGKVWTFPELIIDPLPQQVNSEKKPLSFKMSTSCQTEPRDFDYLYKASSGNGNVNLISYSVITAKHYNEVSEKCEDLKLTVDSDTYSVVTFDKSTSTDDMVDDIEISQKLAHLQSCFPDISNEDLLHLLEICYNDERWISNLLLDWGYKYNVPTDENPNEKDEEDKTNRQKRYNINSFVYEDGIDFSIWKSSALSKSSTGSSLDTDISSKSSSEESKEALPAEVVEEKNVKFQFVLDPTFAHQLEQHFGPLPNSENRRVDVDYKFSKLIYEKWKNTLPSTENPIKNDENRNLKNSKSKKKKSKQNNKSNKTTPIKNVSSREIGDSSFCEIMDMEFARQLHIERMKKDDDFRTKMKRSELYNMFPGADTIVLDEIFESNNYSLEDSLRILGTDITQQETIEKKRNVEKFDARIKEWEKTNIFQEFENGDWSDWVYQDNNSRITQEIILPVPSTTISAKAAALREEAAEHYQLRQEYIQKAQAAYCRGMRDVASFYAQQGTEEGRIAKDTNKLAATLIAQERNSSSPVLKIDLHGLHIQEAISLLEKFLYDKKLEIRRRLHTTPIVVTIITGQGLHSAQGAKLRPAVLNYLKSSKYNFSETKIGQIEVTLMGM